MIITSLLDTDLYKFTMMQVVLHHFPGANVEYRFKCRNPGIDLASHVDEIREQVHWLCTLRFREQELAYLSSLRFINSRNIRSSSRTLPPSRRATAASVRTSSNGRWLSRPPFK